MAQLLFDEQPDDFLTELEATPTKVNLLGRLNTALDKLEADPADPDCRRRRFQNIGCWAITVEADHDAWLILWEAQDDDTAVVRAITREP